MWLLFRSFNVHVVLQEVVNLWHTETWLPEDPCLLSLLLFEAVAIRRRTSKVLCAITPLTESFSMAARLVASPARSRRACDVYMYRRYGTLCMLNTPMWALEGVMEKRCTTRTMLLGCNRDAIAIMQLHAEGSSLVIKG